MTDTRYQPVMKSQSHTHTHTHILSLILHPANQPVSPHEPVCGLPEETGESLRTYEENLQLHTELENRC